PDKCVFGSGIGGCVDYGYDAAHSSADGIVINNYGAAITSSVWNFTVVGTTCPLDQRSYSINVSGQFYSNTGSNTDVSVTTSWPADERLIVAMQCSGGFTSGDTVKATIRMVGAVAGKAYNVSNAGTFSIKIP
ncbi:MAG: hypothetical protein V1725_03850, partial [archaeon]